MSIETPPGHETFDEPASGPPAITGLKGTDRRGNGIWGPEELRAAAAELAVRRGGLAVSSGGTTGKPKLTLIAPDMGIPRLRETWDPLAPGDVLLNLFSAGRMWGAHHFYNTLAFHSCAVAAPIGSLSDADVDQWAATLADLGVTALAGAPNVLARIARRMVESGIALPVRTVIWSGEPMTPARLAAIQSAFPKAETWANYGSIETFVIGVNWPVCPADTVHLLPDQLLELDEERALLTRFGEGWPAPAVRYRLGDRLRETRCACGRGDAFNVAGRADDGFKLYGSRFRVGDLLAQAALIAGVEEAQVVLERDPDEPNAVAAMRLRYTGFETDPTLVGATLAERVHGLGFVAGHSPGAVGAEHADDLERSPKTNKVLPVVWTRALDREATRP
jgi:phenylacetate-coenzyme A ligase PaaK-like adenylate-forming protein